MPTLNQQCIDHILVYECNSDYEGDPIIPAGSCFTPKSNAYFCKKLINGWSTGADKIFYYPKDAAHPLNSDLYSHLMIEIHYNNENPLVLGILRA